MVDLRIWTAPDIPPRVAPINAVGAGWLLKPLVSRHTIDVVLFGRGESGVSSSKTATTGQVSAQIPGGPASGSLSTVIRGESASGSGR